MAKVQQKSEKITAFGGIFFVLDKFDSILSSVIDSHLGLRSTLIGYQHCFCPKPPALVVIVLFCVRRFFAIGFLFIAKILIISEQAKKKQQKNTLPDARATGSVDINGMLRIIIYTATPVRITSS